jgi:hypothetical protein
MHPNEPRITEANSQASISQTERPLLGMNRPFSDTEFPTVPVDPSMPERVTWIVFILAPVLTQPQQLPQYSLIIGKSCDGC